MCCKILKDYPGCPLLFRMHGATVQMGAIPPHHSRSHAGVWTSRLYSYLPCGHSLDLESTRGSQDPRKACTAGGAGSGPGAPGMGERRMGCGWAPCTLQPVERARRTPPEVIMLNKFLNIGHLKIFFCRSRPSPPSAPQLLPYEW